MKKTIKNAASVITLLTIFCFFTAASQVKRTDFSGAWNINLDKSENGTAAPVTMKITQSTDSLIIERTTSDDKSFVEKLSFDGKTNVCTTTSNRKKSGSAHWNEDGSSFIETAVLGDMSDPDKVAFNVTEQWKISTDQKELTVESLVKAADGREFKINAVFERQQ